jgi:hypothetical protein
MIGDEWAFRREVLNRVHRKRAREDGRHALGGSGEQAVSSRRRRGRFWK